ncbi:PREDICTED: probable pectinesterase 67 [Tarenaya hassleriana]|uniref:probable pectinesterase 67 n=1 Tax=Tarenaya hassleriana TaxID=28532 RepID=UPI00053C6F99|nr:PREDICTED: probable pectinesterase 67 [Tarenaya hassleriana]
MEEFVRGMMLTLTLTLTLGTATMVADASAMYNLKFDAPLLTEKIATNRSIIVDIQGDGDYTSIQQAIDAVPHGNPGWIIVHVRKGIYRERVHIPESKPFIFMRGNGKGKTIIQSSQSSDDNVESATFKVEGNHFVAFGISIRNDAPIGMAFTSQNQSVAAFVAADKVAFYHCAFYSLHNTLFDNKGRHYYYSCYIQGSIDFIFGRATSVFHGCEIFVISDKRVEPHGSITAQNRETEEEKTGFVFVKGKVYGIDSVYLGRAKGPFSRVVFAKTYLSKTVVPRGWTNWSYNGSTQNMYHGEYKCHGPGADSKERASWAKQLSKSEAQPFLSIDFIDGSSWLPVWLPQNFD